MSYDYVKHSLTDRFEGETHFDGPEFTIRLGREMGARWMAVGNAMVVAAIFAMMTAKAATSSARALPFAVGFGAISASLLAFGLLRATNRYALRSRDGALWLVRGPLLPSERRLAAVDAIDRVTPIIAPYNRVEALSALGRHTTDAYRPWTVELTTVDESFRLPLRLRSEQAERLAATLQQSLAERRSRIGLPGGYR